MYFAEFPDIYYDFEIKGKRELRIVKDIARNVRFRKEVLANVTLYDEYDMKDGETPEIVAEKFYGSPEYHWVVMLVNERYDAINEFPLAVPEFEEYIRDRYGDVVKIRPTANVVNSDEINVVSTAGLQVGWEIQYVESGDTLSTTNYITEINSATKFTVRDQINNLPSSQVIVIDPVYGTHHYINEQGYIVNSDTPGAAPVSNYEYESQLNESKRRIKLISPTMLNTLLNNFKELM